MSKLSDKNRLSLVFPDLSKQWHLTKNGNLSPDKVSIGSNKKIWWRCEKGHEWLAFIYNRVAGKGCPFCSGQKVCVDNCLSVLCPDIAAQWHPTLNESLTPNDVTHCSGKKVWWLCEKKHSWSALVSDRVNGKGCVYCAGQKVCKDNCLTTLRPDIAVQWHPTKNGELTPNDVTCGSNRKVWWLCEKCNEEWLSPIINRTRKNNRAGCPYCGGKKVCKSNCLATLRPDIAKQWHLTLNGGLVPSDVTCGSGKMVWWVCERCNCEWKAFVYNRVNGGSCPICSRSNISPVSQKWLDSLEVLQENREVLLPELNYRVDAFVPETNTVYEFFGDYWHGNPAIYDKNQEHPVCGKTFGQLYDETKARISRLKWAGYKVVYVWEKDFRKGKLSKTKVSA